VKNIGFVQPLQLAPWLEQTGVFILPAHYEHWGVAVHEFAAAGFPLLCSTTTSAATTFLEEGVNGFFTEPKSKASIREVLIKTIGLSDKQLADMGKKSTELAHRITPDTWSDTLWNLVNEKNYVRN
jgi:glycosyltransferase involved in cell wall biosynthesis